MRLLDEGAYKDNLRKEQSVNIFDTVYTKRNVHNLPELCSFVTIVVVLLLCLLTRYNLRENLPKALDNSDLLQNPHSFIAERAWKDLKILTSFGPRPTGAYSNEVLAVDFLKREISYIKQMAHRNQRIELDVQVVSGAFWSGFKPYGMTSVYRNVQNVAVKLHGSAAEYKKNSTILINCHFDSVPGSTGASDDAASCVVMLEVLRVLSRHSTPNRHTLLFLFNGAEETGLQGAHGFITQHKWAREIRAFINLESVGSGGKELLFQSAKNSPWLLKMYAKAVPYPSAQVAAEEVFQSGLIPSDTDFRIFRDFGQLPGLDFAHIINGYRYHTKFDHMDYIPRNALQHTGENVLHLAKYMANSELLTHAQGAGGNGSLVFFDVFGLLFVSYSEEFAIIMNYVIVSCAVLIPYLFLSRATRGINKKHLRYEIFLGFLINMISLVASGAVCYAMAYDLDTMGKSMTWYSNTFMCVPTYCLANVFVQCVAHLIFNRNPKAPISIALQTQARLIGTSFFWGILAAALTGAGIRTAYAIVVPLSVTLLANLFIGLMKYQNSIHRWLYVHLIGQVFVVLWTSNFYHMVVDMFIPTAGRSGGSKNPDIMIAMICSSLTFFITSYLSPLVILLKKSKNFLISLFAIYIVTRFYFIAFTHYGFPYRDESLGQPKVQRHYITHAVRTLYDKEGNIRYTDSGFWMRELDRNAHKTIESLTMPDEPIPQDTNILCKNEVFCGLPLYSARQLQIGGFWIPGPAPVIPEIAQLKMVQHERIDAKLHRMHFIISGSFMISLQIRPKESVRLHHWSLLPNVPTETIYNKQKSYFVMISHGLEAEPMNITLDLMTTGEHHKRSLVDITLVTLHWEFHKDHTPTFANLLAKLPRWAFAVPSVASIKSWTF